MYLYIYIYIYVYIYVCIYICIYIYMYVCINDINKHRLLIKGNVLAVFF